ncbi:MAG: helix-hairpin-helix domain-containing protein [Oscillospiraceae bacterium]|nr:helix-hairpin-helix domain-containing protein [Oscillospiraceae bacterium]
MEKGKIAKTEWLLLGMTALFLCFLLALFFRDRAAPAGVAMETAVPQEELLPDLTPLDLNTAAAEELETLPGIGEELARRIVEYRTEHGPFQTVEDIMLVSGIGEGKFAALEGRITVDGKEKS